MARIRTHKPEFWQNPKLNRCSRDARLTMLGLMNEADDEGKLRYSPKRLAGALFGDDDDVDAEVFHKWIGELHTEGLVLYYEIGGAQLLLLPGFSEHQRISHPTPSRLPGPSAETLEAFAKDRGWAPESVYREGKGREQGRAKRDAYSEEFSTAWEHYPRKLAKTKAFKAYQARRREGVSADELRSAVVHYAETVRTHGTEDRFVKHGATFFGPDEHWKDYLEAPRKASPPPDGQGPRYCDKCSAVNWMPGTGPVTCRCEESGA